MIEFYNLENIDKGQIKYPDIYFTPEYGRACEYSDNAIWELCKFKDLIYVYLKRPIEYENKIYYDLITPYGYSGYYYEKKETFNEFIILFRSKAKDRNYITEVLRQNPYLNIKIDNFDTISCKTIYGLEIDNFDNYFKHKLDGKKRNMFRKGLRSNYTFRLYKLESDILEEKFKKLYIENMKKINSSNYYFFNDRYFKCLEKIDNSFLAIVKDSSNNIIGSSIIYRHKNIVHYHLSCNNSSSNCITDFMLINVIKELCIDKLFILGGGLKEMDSLSKFKKKLSNKEFQYTIYKNIINKEIYDKLSKGKVCDFFPPYKTT